MNEISVELLKAAIKKLLTAAYFDKTDLIHRHCVASFVKGLSVDETKAISELQKVANGENEETVENWLAQISLIYYPKKVSSATIEDKHVVTNIPASHMQVDRLMVKANIPVELCVLDTVWLLLYGYKVDRLLLSNSYGNRMDLVADNSGVRRGNAIFKKYQNQYKSWWENGISVANQHLKEKEDVTIINFDITNCYHSIDFNFEDFLNYYDEHFPEDKIKEDSLTQVIRQIYERYWIITKSSDAEPFRQKNAGKSPLPLSLMSAHLFANWYLSPLDDYIMSQYQPLYYGRYVDDCMVIVKTKSNEETLLESIEKELPSFIRMEGDNASFAFAQQGGNKPIDRLATFELQQDKMYVYRFNCLLPQQTLDKFVEDQMERSSEYRFLSDDVETGHKKLEFVTLISTLDKEEETGRRFDILDENRYKLAVYLSRLNGYLAKYGADYEHYDEVEKVYRYFTGGLLIKHYQMWERILTAFVLAARKDYAVDFIKKAKEQIKALQIKEGLFEIDKESGRSIICKSLKLHLEQSALMAYSLNKDSDDIDMIYLDTFMTRMHYNQLPMQEFSDGYDSAGVRLTMNDLCICKEKLDYQWIPYYVKYYSIVSYLSIGDVFKPDVFERAFEIYRKLNHVGNSFDWKAFCRPPQDKDDLVTEINVDLAWEPQYEEKRTVGIVEMDFTEDEASSVIDNYSKKDAEKIKLYDSILDQITKRYRTDIFILPELALPIYELMEYCRYSASREVAFISGMEYVVKDGVVYNYVVTCLPVTLYGQRDAIPVIRLKNHYAPKEIMGIEGKGGILPPKGVAWQILFHWHGHVFTCYYCFELTSIRERSQFYSQVDAIYCPVLNKDTYYFNNIAESMVRDMHCYFVLCNVSHYGDSRVTVPASHIGMNVMRVKGGNTADNKAVVLSAELDTDALRAFQQKPLKLQEADKSFKMTPPDYNKKELGKRIHERYIYPHPTFEEEMITNIAVSGMKF